MKRAFNLLKKDTFEHPKSLASIYASPGASKDIAFRVAMTTSAHLDTDDIPKVKNAGKIVNDKDESYQVMHNGLQVVRGGYFDDWMEAIIANLKGHHEPQEERAFYEVLKRIDSKQPTMIELGSYWAYYSMWFSKELKSARNYCFEPDEKGLELGQKNAARNKLNLVFEQAAGGAKSGEIATIVSDTRRGQTFDVPIKAIDDILSDKKIKMLDILHMDIQGAELKALQGAQKSMIGKKIRFVFVSTHHQAISGDPIIHKKCLDFIKLNGGHIIAEHSVYESFSGDGLIVASFQDKDADFTIDISHNRPSQSLNRTPEEDLAILSEEYLAVCERLRKA